MSWKRILGTAAAAAILAAIPATASAQIYAWRDAAGNLVLSDKAKTPTAQSYAVTPAGAFRTTRPVSKRAAQYEHLIRQHSLNQGVSPDLVRAVIQAESAFNPNALSHKGAMGLMQLMPATCQEYGVSNPYDPADNIRAGVQYLKRLLIQYSNNVELALAAYNAGPGAVAKYGTRVPPYRETRNYVAKVKDHATAQGPIVSPTKVYRTVEIINGREVVRYTDSRKPTTDVVKAAERR